MNRRTQSILVTAVLALFTGCSAPWTPTSLAPPYEPTGAVRAEDLMPLPMPNGGPGMVQVTDAQGERHRVVNTAEPAVTGALSGETTGAGAWRMRVAGFWAVDVVREASGEVTILREVELAESRRVDYDPPLALLPADLTMDDPVVRVSGVRVYDHENGTLQATGTCTATYRLLGTQQLALPGGTTGGTSGGTSGGKVMATVVQTDRRYDLPWVTVDMHILSGYEPGRGLVARVIRRDMRLLGLLPVRREQSIVRVR